jgi:disulfide bond formation protein DsbB
MTLSQFLDRPVLVFAGLGLGSAAMLAGAFAFEYIGGLEPCVLCWWQRYPYGLVIGLAVIGGVSARGPGPTTGMIVALMGLSALALFTDAAIAGFHVGVEQKWWQGTQGCVGAVGADTLEALRAQLLTQKVVRCDEIAWSLAGISMAGYNMLAALGLGVFATLATMRLMKPISGDGGTDG